MAFQSIFSLPVILLAHEIMVIDTCSKNLVYETIKHGYRRCDHNLSFHLSSFHQFHNIIYRIHLRSEKSTS